MTPRVPSGATSAQGNHWSLSAPDIGVICAGVSQVAPPSCDAETNTRVRDTGEATSWVPWLLSVQVTYKVFVPGRGSAAMLPPVGTRIAIPLSVCRPSSLVGKSVLPSSWSATWTGAAKVAPPSVEDTTRYWDSNCSPDSQAASCWPFWKATCTAPSGVTTG